MEEERLVLDEAVEGKVDPTNLAASIRDRFDPLGGVELDMPPTPADGRAASMRVRPILSKED